MLDPGWDDHSGGCSNVSGEKYIAVVTRMKQRMHEHRKSGGCELADGVVRGADMIGDGARLSGLSA